MTQTVEHAPEPTDAPAPERGGNGVGIAAFVTGALGLAPIALILGIVGLARYRAGRASRRSWALAGVVLGAVGLVAGAAFGVVYATSSAPAITQDAHAKVDAVNLGNAMVDWSAGHQGEAPSPALTDGGYDVDGVQIASALDPLSGRTVTMSATAAYEWCVTLGYDAGESASVAYSATEGLVDSCAAD